MVDTRSVSRSGMSLLTIVWFFQKKVHDVIPTPSSLYCLTTRLQFVLLRSLTIYDTPSILLFYYFWRLLTNPIGEHLHSNLWLPTVWSVDWYSLVVSSVSFVWWWLFFSTWPLKGHCENNRENYRLKNSWSCDGECLRIEFCRYLSDLKIRFWLFYFTLTILIFTTCIQVFGLMCRVLL